ncbi:putative Xaa-Pro aminopeptidase pepP [Patellaria atrata CBS 101060]|uniref:Xaa-Pro aminopeptidase n=1 Tax=Patellaria atrata CBS 101060 TaxID=1346257 RepID=A0A9P4VNW8_9PEZI|nr:putative Xaa-Pro aminopeptidase pepP [Patellaria atrata CBS 101060]
MKDHIHDGPSKPNGKYPAKQHAKQVKDYILRNGGTEGVIYLEAQKTRMLEDNDSAAPFRQRRYFFYLSGCELPDSFLTYDMKEEKLTLLIPPVDPEEVVWSGFPVMVQDAFAKYDVDDVKTTPGLNSHLATYSGKVYAIENQVSDQTTFLSFSSTDFTTIKTAIEECRVVKTDYELELMKHAAEVSVEAHIEVMKAVKFAHNEQDLEAIFIKSCIERGCREQAYHQIIASGKAAATLHYVHNDKPLGGKLNLLIDAGAESSCYAADITRCYPIKGKFTPESKSIYNLVLRMQEECMAMIKEGVLWEDVHVRAHRVAIDGLLQLKILVGDTDEIFEARTSVAFFPHGLGHYLGMDTHDTGGHANYNDPDPMFRYLRTRGELPYHSMITVEPGIYFCEFIIKPYLHDDKHSKFINTDVLEDYWEVGGVRIEDDVLVTRDGCDNLTANCPKTVEELERIVSLARE